MKVRLANAGDVNRVYRWANEPEVRRWSLSQDPITWKDHQRWFSSVLADPACVLFIGEMEGPVGSVRFEEVAPGCVEVSIMLDPRYRGSGLSRRLLEAAMLAYGPAVFMATVKMDNVRSMWLFSHWTQVGVENGLATFTTTGLPMTRSNG